MLWICLGTAIGVFMLVAGFMAVLLLSKTKIAQDLVASRSDEAESSSTSIGVDGRTPLTEIENRSDTSEPSAAESIQRIGMESTREGILGDDVRSDRMTTAFADLRRRNFQLELPGRGQDLDFTETKLATLPLSTTETLQLALLSVAVSNIKLVPQTDAPPDMLVWNAIKLADVGFGTQEEVALGKFTHHSGELRFQWAEAAAWAKSGSLQFVPLEIKIGANRQVCQLWKSISANPIRIRTDGVSSGVVPLTEKMIDRPSMFRVEFQLVGTGEIERPSATALMGETARILLGDDRIELELKLVLSDGQSSVQARLYAEPLLLKKEITTKGPRQEITPTVIDEHLRQLKTRDPKKRDTGIAKLQAQSKSLLKLMGQKSEQKPEQKDDQNGLEKQIEAINAKIAKLESELAAMQEAFTKNVEWYQSTADILQKLGDQGQLCFAVYTAADPRIVVIETSGFDKSNK